jgi:uncharacterized membrane protein YfcA
MQIAGFILLGLTAGALSGLLGLGGGLVMIPALVMLFGFTQHQAQGTSLAVMLPPVGLLAVMQYHRQGYLNIQAAAIMAICFVVGTYVSSSYVSQIPEATLKRLFGLLICFVGGQMLMTAKPGETPWAWLLGGAGAAALGGASAGARRRRAEREHEQALRDDSEQP